jgi:hypothetical protein
MRMRPFAAPSTRSSSAPHQTLNHWNVVGVVALTATTTSAIDTIQTQKKMPTYV